MGRAVASVRSWRSPTPRVPATPGSREAWSSSWTDFVAGEPARLPELPPGPGLHRRLVARRDDELGHLRRAIVRHEQRLRVAVVIRPRRVLRAGALLPRHVRGRVVVEPVARQGRALVVVDDAQVLPLALAIDLDARGQA